VDALGDGTEGFRVGEYVSVNPNMNCGHCEYCRIGRTLLCDNLKGLGTNWPGSFAEYVVVPAGLLLAQLIARGGATSVTVAASSAFKLKRAEDLGLDATFLMDRADLAGD